MGDINATKTYRWEKVHQQKVEPGFIPAYVPFNYPSPTEKQRVAVAVLNLLKIKTTLGVIVSNRNLYCVGLCTVYGAAFVMRILLANKNGSF